MNTRSGVPLATALPLTAALPPLLVGLVALFAPEWVVVLLGVVFAITAGASVWALLQPLAKAALAADAVTAGELASTLPDGSAEGGRLVAAAKAVEERLTADLDAANAATASATKRGNELQQKLSQMQKVLNAVPVPVAVASPEGRLLLMNATAEAQFGLNRQAWASKGVDALLAEPTEARATKNWLANGLEPRREAAGRDAAGRRVLMEWSTVPTAEARRDGLHVFAAIDLTRSRQFAAAGRAALAKRMIRRLTREHADPLHGLDANLRLLLQETKQDGHRDRLVPKVNAAVDSARRMRAVYAVLEWWDRLDGPKPPVPSPSEFIAGEAVHAVRDLLGPRLRGQRNSLTVRDEGGWVLCDADMLQGALTAILLHACDTVSGGAIEVRIRRAESRDGERIRFEVIDAGRAPSAAALAALAWPFATEANPPDEFPGVGGFPLALAVARRLATPLAGTLTLVGDANGQLVATLELPCRPGLRPLPAASDNGEIRVAPEEETCVGWRLGFGE